MTRVYYVHIKYYLANIATDVPHLIGLEPDLQRAAGTTPQKLTPAPKALKHISSAPLLGTSQITILRRCPHDKNPQGTPSKGNQLNISILQSYQSGQQLPSGRLQRRKTLNAKRNPDAKKPAR